MEINQMVENDVTVLNVSGRLDTNTAPQLESAVQGVAAGSSLTLDLKGVEYVSSAGLRVFLMAQKTFGQKFLIRNVQDSVKEVLEITGFTDILRIE